MLVNYLCPLSSKFRPPVSMFKLPFCIKREVPHVCPRSPGNIGINLSMGIDQGVPRPKTKRPFCHGCGKAAILCICNRIEKTVDNAIGITILQHTEEKKHPVGSARVASLGLKNVQLISVPELELETCYRIRPKVPGSKRSLAGRVGKKGRIHRTNSGGNPHPDDSAAVFDGFCEDPAARDMIAHGFGVEKFYIGQEVLDSQGTGLQIPAWISIPSGSALLYPSEKAVDLTQDLAVCQIKHLVVLDGTWGKAKRIYSENPWLRLLPHFRLSPNSPSLYSEVRRQPKVGCLSTIESIVYALKILEPQTDGLDSLLQVFDSMVCDQRRCKEDRLRKLAEA